MNACLVGLPDRHVEELLHACGVRAAPVVAEDLATLAHPSAPQPDVIVLDLRNSIPLPASVAAIRRQHPMTGIVVVASHLDPVLMLEAMRAGVTEFVTETTTPHELRLALDRVVASRPQPDPGQVFAFVGGKGGIGTTTLAVNVAAALVGKQSSSVLLVDLHVAYGDVAVFLGVEPRFSVADALENADRMDGAFLRSVVAKTKTGVDALVSPDRAVVGHVDTRAVRRLIDCAARHYPVVVLDVPRSDAVILDALDQTTRIVVVANQELATVRSAGRMVAALRQRYGKAHVAAVVSRFDQDAEIGRADVERVMGGAVADVFPSNYRLALDALNRGRPLVLDNHSKLADAYAAFAQTLAKRAPAEPAVPERPGLLGRLGLR
jgi:pilus assembly protein CpaE